MKAARRRPHATRARAHVYRRRPARPPAREGRAPRPHATRASPAHTYATRVCPSACGHPDPGGHARCRLLRPWRSPPSGDATAQRSSSAFHRSWRRILRCLHASCLKICGSRPTSPPVRSRPPSASSTTLADLLCHRQHGVLL